MILHGAIIKRVKIFIKIFLIFLVAIFAVPYSCDAINRSAAHECERDSVGGYIGETCLLTGDYGTLFRLYDARTGELLAECTYLSPEARRVFRSKDDVVYDVGASDGSGHIALPPTRWDWLRARLP